MLHSSRIKIYKTFATILETLKCLFLNSYSNFKNDLEIYLSEKVFLVPQARVGIFYVLKYLKEEKNINSVFISPYTNIDVINAIRYANLNIEFIDINLNTGYPTNLKEEIKKPDESCLIITHLYSNTNMITEFIKETNSIKNLEIIEDTAICFGAKYNNIFLGKLFNYGVYSFGLVKNLTTFFGGAVVTKDAKFKSFYENQIKNNIDFPKLIILKKLIYIIILKILFESKLIFNLLTIYLLKFAYKNETNFLYKSFYHQKFPKIENKITKNYFLNFPFFLSNIGCRALSECDKHINIRFEKALYYFKSLSGIDEILLPKLDIKDKQVNAYLEYPIILKESKKNLLLHLRKKKIYIRHVWYENNNKFFNFTKKSLKNCNKLSESLICLPCHIDIEKDYQKRIIEEIQSYFKQIK